MIIKSITLDNFRIYKGENRVDLTSDGKKNIIIISGHNGFGKTTFLMSLVWCLYGRQMNEVDDLYQKEISDIGGYPKYIINSLNRQAKIVDDRSFSVSVVISEAIIPDMQCNEIEIRRTHHITEGDKVQIFIDGIENELIKSLANEKGAGEEVFIRDYLMPIEIAKFFFFDAEKIVTLAEVNTVEQRKKLSIAYSEILGIKKYEDLRANLVDLLTKLRQSEAGPEEQKKLNTLRANIENFAIEIAAKEGNKNDLRDKRDEKRAEANKLQEKLIQAGNVISSKELAELKTEEKDLDETIAMLQNDLRDHYELIPFAIAGGGLLEVIKQLNNEASYKTAQFKQEEIQEASNRVLTDLLAAQRSFKKVIDNEVHEFYTNTFKQLIRRYFFTDTPELTTDFQVLHEFSDAERNEVLTLANQLKLSFKESFGRINNGYNQSRQALITIRRRLKAAEAHEEDPIWAADRARKEQLERDIVRLESDMEAIDREIGQIQEQQRAAKAHYSELAKRLEKSAINRDKDEIISRQIVRLKTYIAQFQEDKKRSLEKAILTGLQTLMHKKDFVHNVEVKIAGGDIDINLLNQRDQIIPKASLSKNVLGN
jgi:DNA sulfur modification protein DndD